VTKRPSGQSGNTSKNQKCDPKSLNFGDEEKKKGIAEAKRHRERRPNIQRLVQVTTSERWTGKRGKKGLSMRKKKNNLRPEDGPWKREEQLKGENLLSTHGGGKEYLSQAT